MQQVTPIRLIILIIQLSRKLLLIQKFNEFNELITLLLLLYLKIRNPIMLRQFFIIFFSCNLKINNRIVTNKTTKDSLYQRDCRNKIQYIMDDEQFFEQPDENSEIVEIKELFPANPIYDKPQTLNQQKPVLHIDLTHRNQIVTQEHGRPTFKKATEPNEEVDEPKDQLHGFEKYYQAAKCVYRRYNNTELNKYRGNKYYASCFIDKRFFLQNKEEIRSLSEMHKEFFNDSLKIGNLNPKTDVVFDSDFESGNLFAAFKKSGTQYDLILQNDMNSKGNTQWFYFTVQNLPQNIEITFNIMNLLKSDSLFNYGMQPAVFSEIKHNRSGQSWTRQGRCVNYYKNTIRRERSKRYYYTLTFRITSKITGDKLHIAHCFPYTYSMLNSYLANIFKTCPRKGLTLTRKEIGKTKGNNPLEVITISQFNAEKEVEDKTVVVVMARQHPGESQGSYVCQGLMNFLLSKTKQAQFLRKNVIFKIIPMLNPDGVIVGNYRTNLMGCDLNRKWDQFDKNKIFPQVSTVKYYISELNKEKKIKVILDLHGHSKKQLLSIFRLNSFFYGNPFPEQPEYVRGFPYACSRLCDKICFQDCTFSISEQKKKAARVYLSLLYQIIHVYTFESSFVGFQKEGKKIPFGIEDYKGLGASLCLGLFSFIEFENLLEQKMVQKIETINYSKYLAELKENLTLLNMGEGVSSGSQSEPDQFQIEINEVSGNLEILEDQKVIVVDGGTTKVLPEHNIYRSPLEAATIEPERRRIQSSVGSRAASTNPMTRKTYKRIKATKESTKNPRELRVLQMSRVNSVLPDKYSFGLEPVSNNVSTTLNPNEPGQSQRKPSVKRKRTLHRSIGIQTDLMDRSQWVTLKSFEPYQQLPQASFRSRPISSSKHNELKYISLASNRVRNALVLKLELMSRPLEPMANPASKISSTESQTLLTACALEDRPAITDRQSNRSSRVEKIRSVSRRESPEVSALEKDVGLNYIKGRKINMFKYDPVLIQKSFLISHLPEGEDGDLRPLSIRRKEILLQRKQLPYRPNP